MHVLVLPVSGGGFVSQLGIIQHLCEAKIIPDVVLASSGGNVAAYVAAAANWKWPAIERISKELTQSLFLKPWSSVSTLAFIIGYFKGNVYSKGSGVHDFLLGHFTEETIKNYEIWTGTYNKNKQKARLFCNRKKSDSIINLDDEKDYNLTQCMEPIFADGNIEIISKAGVASASIPAIVPAELINDEYYIDGGIAAASPLTLMQDQILRHIKIKNEPLHIIYINSIDLESTKLKHCHNVLDTWKQATYDLVRSQTVIDRYSGYSMIRCQAKSPTDKLKHDEFKCDSKMMEKIKKLQATFSYSMLEIYPTINIDVNLTSFNGNDVINCISKSYKNCKCRFWWIEP